MTDVARPPTSSVGTGAAPGGRSVGGVASGEPVTGEVGFDLPLPLGRVRRRRHRIVLTEDAIAFRAGAAEQWRVPWTAVRSAQVADVYDLTTSAQSAFLVLDLDPVPDHPSLHDHEGKRWFLLTGTDVPARLDRELDRRLGPRHLRATSASTVPPRLRSRPTAPARARP